MPPKKANSGERTEITVGEAEHQHAGNREVLAAIAELRADLTKATSDICSTLRGEIATLRSENEAAISALRKKFDRHDDKLKEMADSAESANNTVADLQTQVKQLTKQVEQLSEKCVDLEGRSKRQNIRIAGVKEGKEYGQRVSDFVAQLLKTTLALDDTPLLDRAHRALRVRPGDDEPPRHLIARVHYCHTLDEILRKSSVKKNVMFGEDRIVIFRDLPQAVVKRRAAFTPARNLLRDKPGVRFGLLYPAKLRVTHNGSEAVFTDPNEARRYAQERFGSG
ncbi:hypothetical protein WMY93_009522 [Mugilogobius chulae]|uniref:Transposase element L1Md-A101/L1Md-A102/L1Md-A2 n=1 Tax=Mugilogobius chulae TaxID=88201 RepID=A0AAW0PKU9_9GOBI